ncbi:MAG: hypothetical protein OZ921_18985 [Sorangiineae bacterium]|nr:hypothetical protein [Polyangiaceae bacterium]MEB2324609.1 hypothetical protein [Sorangiineae bacterium]
MSSPRAWLWFWSVLTCVLAQSTRAEAQQRVFPPQREAQILAMVEPYRLGVPAADGLELSDVSIEPKTITWKFSEGGAVVFSLRLSIERADAVVVSSEPPAERLPPRARASAERLLSRLRAAEPPSVEMSRRSPTSPRVVVWIASVPAPLAWLIGVATLSLAGLARERGLGPRSTVRYWLLASVASLVFASVPLVWSAL